MIRAPITVLRSWQRRSLELALLHGDIQAVQRLTVGLYEAMLDGRLALDEFVITAGLWREEQKQIDSWHSAANSNVDKPRTPQGAVARKVCRRDPRRRFVTGERLAFVFCVGDERGENQIEQAEDVQWALQHSLRPCIDTYIHKFTPVISRTLAPLLGADELRSLLSTLANMRRTLQPMAATQRAKGVWAGFEVLARCLACAKAAGTAGSGHLKSGLCRGCDSEETRAREHARAMAALNELDRELLSLERRLAAMAGCRFWAPIGTNFDCRIDHIMQQRQEVLFKIKTLL